MLVHDIFEVELQSLFVGGRFRDAFSDLDDDGAEAGGVEVDFLVVWDFADVAGAKKRG